MMNDVMDVGDNRQRLVREEKKIKQESSQQHQEKTLHIKGAGQQADHRISACVEGSRSDFSFCFSHTSEWLPPLAVYCCLIGW